MNTPVREEPNYSVPETRAQAKRRRLLEENLEDPNVARIEAITNACVPGKF
jgi:hypothetical protein